MSNLKSQNYLNLAALMATPFLPALIFYSVLYGAPSWEDFGMAGTATCAVVTALIVMLADAMPQGLKHQLIFLRWKNPLPGHRCDTLCAADPRIEPCELVSRWPEVFGADVSEQERNARWYQQIYKPVQDNPAVQSTHRKFLLYRDTTAGSLLLLLAIVAAMISGLQESALLALARLSLVFTGSLLVYYWCNAALYGKRLVVNAVTNA